MPDDTVSGAGSTGSPFASGGGGVTFEHRALARCLSVCLVGNQLILPGPVTEVRAQQRHRSALYDDIVVVSTTRERAYYELECQARHRPRLSASSRETKSKSDLHDLIELGIASIRENPDGFARGERRLALICGPETANSTTLQAICDLARQHSSEASLILTLAASGRVRQPLRTMWERLVSITARAADATPDGARDWAWRWCANLSVLRWSLDNQAATERVLSINELAGLWRPRDVERAATALARLEGLAAELAAAGGDADAAMIRRHLGDILPAAPLEVGDERRRWCEEQQRKSVGRLRASLRVLGVSDAAVTNLVATLIATGMDERLAMLAPGQVVGLRGAVGVGKSTAAELAMQFWLEKAKVGGLPPPVRMRAQEIDGRLDEARARDAPPADSTAGFVLIIDGLDEVGVVRAEELLREAIASAYAERGRVIVTSRPIVGITDGDFWVDQPLLSMEQAESIIGVVSGNPGAPSLYGIADAVRDAAQRPLYAVLLGTWYRDQHAGLPRGPGELLEHLVRQSLGRVESSLARQLLREIARAALDGESRRVRLSSIGGAADNYDVLRRTGLVVSDLSGHVELALPLLDEYFAAEHLLTAPLAAADIAASRPRLLRWRYAIAAAVGRATWDQSAAIMQPLAREAPAVASWIAGEAVPEDWRGPWGTVEAMTLGRRLRDATAAWAAGLNPLAPLIVPAKADSSLAALGVAAAPGRVATGWYRGDDAAADVVPLPPGVHPFADVIPAEWALLADEPQGWQEGWPWRWARDLARAPLAQLLQHGVLTVAGGPLADEEDWALAQRILGRRPNAVGVEPVAVSEVRGAIEKVAAIAAGAVGVTGPAGPWSFAAARDLVARRQAHGEEIAYPWEAPDRAGSYVWDWWSIEALVRRLRAVTAAGFAAYDLLTTAWFPRMRADLRTLAGYPCRLEGAVAPAPEGGLGHPTIRWYLVEAQPDQHLAVEWSVTSADELERRDSEFWANRRKRLSRLPAVIHYGVPGIWDARPAATFSYGLLWDDLGEWGWTSGPRPSDL
jgi:hypothetical protein